MPAFAHWFGIRPWEVCQLTLAEIDEFQRQIKALHRAARKG